jgi:hypothetical protein
MERITETSPPPKARIAGLFYLLVLLTGAGAAVSAGWLYLAMPLLLGQHSGARTFVPVGSQPTFGGRVLYSCYGSLL